ncbi:MULTISPECIES: hypothetical protein [Cyanophyceae]|uniref:hypothetical protein n=1 Tax=Cyanophyceae TaxID=3028117 RepID=UPI0016857669|nr:MULTISPECIES: hypothetical protein [Cyanophyceae]MBD1914872.1 hypothetical protein [Phormidium sp. FACHB-77]MBD2028550.1 hypothetical protein [Phormidium sp. FACHB-322]MBD2051806.1 hypothetical protein [Leptolyngbya sp. FACHB-60]
MSNSDSAPENNSLKSLLIKGLVGGVALVGTTAIPIVVQRSLETPPVSPAGSAATVPVSPAQLSPLPDSSQVNSATTRPAIDEDKQEDSSDEKGKKKRVDD